MRPLARAVFLDRDDTLIRDLHYGCDPEGIELLDGVALGLRMLQAAGYRLVVVTNQSGVARGYFAEDAVEAMHTRLDEVLRAEGVRIDGYYHCPHHPDGVVPEYALACRCRKPQPGLIRKAAIDLGLDLRSSWVIGNAPSDVQAGRAARCRTVLLGSAEEPESQPEADLVASSFLDAVEGVLAADLAESSDVAAA